MYQFLVWLTALQRKTLRFIPTFAYISHSVLFVAEQNSAEWMYHNLPISLSMGTSCFCRRGTAGVQGKRVVDVVSSVRLPSTAGVRRSISATRVRNSQPFHVPPKLTVGSRLF